MTGLLLVAKYIFLTIAIVYTFSNVVKGLRGLGITDGQLWLMAIGIVGYIVTSSNL